MNELLFIIFFLGLGIVNLIAYKMGKIYIFVLIGLYTLMMNIFVTKQFELFGLLITGGNALYGASFLLTDLLSEHYKKEDAKKAVWIGFSSMLIFVVSTQILLAYTPSTEDYAHEALQILFGITPRILAGGLLAYFIAQHIDVYLYHKIKEWTKGKYLFIRNNGSTLISQAIDTVIFTFVGLTTVGGITGVIPLELFWEVTLGTYIVKLLVAFGDTPFIYLSKYITPKDKEKEV